MEPYENPVLGVILADTRDLIVHEDEQLGDGRYGFTVMSRELNEARESVEERMVLRVAWQLDAPPDPERAEAALLDDFPGGSVDRGELSVDGHPARLVEGLPARLPVTYLFVAAHGRLYEIVYGEARLGAAGRALLARLRFVEPTRSLDSLALPSGPEPVTLPEPDPAAPPKASEVDEITIGDGRLPMPASAVPPPVEPGAVNWPAARFIQTPIKQSANGGSGVTRAGPHHFGVGRHGGTNRPGGLNDFYALDLPLRRGDEVLSPFPGTVRWAGVTDAGWHTLGRVVIVEMIEGNDLYWALLAHLSRIDVQRGDPVTPNTVIGRAGGSGRHAPGAPLVEDRFEPHLHMGIYRNARLIEAVGGVHGGQSVQPLNMTFFGNGRGQYAVIKDRQEISW